jgi:hypothetical protein
MLVHPLQKSDPLLGFAASASYISLQAEFDRQGHGAIAFSCRQASGNFCINRTLAGCTSGYAGRPVWLVALSG